MSLQAKREEKYADLVTYLKMARQKVKEPVIDTELVYALAKVCSLLTVLRRVTYASGCPPCARSRGLTVLLKRNEARLTEDAAGKQELVNVRVGDLKVCRIQAPPPPPPAVSAAMPALPIKTRT